MSTEIQNLKINELHNALEIIETDLLLIVIDHKVLALYDKELDFTTIKNKKVIIWKATDGEKTKNLAEYEACTDYFLSRDIHRRAHLVAIGGGAISDFSGFVAATLLRGVPWSVIPTTLLSMVDASIGGKVGINSKQGKNLLGVFHEPEKIYLCESFLNTLPIVELISGKGEVLKYGMLSKEIEGLILQKSPMGEIISACIEYKKMIVLKDFKEAGERKFLNLGHSFGHGIEKIYQVSHGEAVILGMFLIFLMNERKDLILALKELMIKLELGLIQPPWRGKSLPVDDLLFYLKKDKKKTDNDRLDLVLLEKVGSPLIQSTEIEKISGLLEERKDDIKNFSL